MSDWRPGIIAVRCPDGEKSLPGWISEPFGLDWGICEKTNRVMWVVHHLPTGYGVCAVDHEIEQVLQLVDLLRSLGDWSFSDLAGAATLNDTIQVAKASGFVIRADVTIGRPTYPDQLVTA